MKPTVHLYLKSRSKRSGALSVFPLRLGVFMLRRKETLHFTCFYCSLLIPKVKIRTRSSFGVSVTLLSVLDVTDGRGSIPDKNRDL